MDRKNNPHTFAEEMQVISLQDLLAALLRNAKLILAVTGVFFILGIIVAYFKAPVFQSEALVRVAKSGGGSSNLLSKLADVSGMDDMGGSDPVASQQYILTSRGVLQDAIMAHHLDILTTPKYFPIFGKAMANRYDKNLDNLAPAKAFLGMTSYGWGGSHADVQLLNIPDVLLGHKFILFYQGNNQYQLVADDQAILKGEIGKQAEGKYEGQVVQIMVDNISANPGTRFVVEKLSMLDAVTRLQTILQVSPAGMRTDLLDLKTVGLPRENLKEILSAVIDSAISMSINIRAQKAEKILSFIGDQLPTIRSHLDKINSKLSSALPIGSVFANLQREKNIQSMVYTNMLVDIEQYALEKASSMGDITIITPPTAIYPSKQLSSLVLLLLITFVGFLLAASFVFVRHFMLGVVFDPDQVEQISGLSLLAGLQVTKAQSKQVALFKKDRVSYLKPLVELDPEDITLEGFRSLRTALFLNYLSSSKDENIKNKIITINGPVPNVGKSFISVNLAQQLAETGKRTLLIDADIRKGGVSNYFESPSKHKGLVDLLKGSLGLEDCVYKTRIANLDFIPSGNLQAKNVELLMRDNLGEFAEKIKQSYDLIVIDTAPVLAVSDALSLCRHTDINLMAFAHGKHNEREIDLAIKKFEKMDIPLHGFIMNFVPTPTMGYGYGYGYGHGYRYGKETAKA